MSVTPGNENSIGIEIHKDGKLYATVESVRKLKSRYDISTKEIHSLISKGKPVSSNIGEVTLKYVK